MGFLRATTIFLMLHMGMLCLPQEAPLAEVEFIVVDTFGEEIKHFRIEVTDAQGRRISSSGPPSPLRLRLPWGEYVVIARASWFESCERSVNVAGSGPKVVVFGLSPLDASQITGDAPSRFLPIHGRVEPLPARPTQVVVRAISLWGGHVADARLAADGSIDLPDVPYGEYLLLLTREGRILGRRFIKHSVDSASEHLIGLTRTDPDR